MRRFFLSLLFSLALLVSCLFAGTFAQEIRLEALSWTHFGSECLVPVNVVVDAQDKTVSASDIMIESSLTYVDFVPGTLFPYFLPPVTRSNGLLHIVGFTVGNEQRVQWSWVLGTLYMKGKPGSRDGALRLYFIKTWDTTDSNLSIAGGVDVLQSVQNLDVVFDQEACVHPVAELSGGFAGQSYQDNLKKTISAIQEEYPNRSWMTILAEHSVLFISSFLLLLLLILVILYRKKLISSFAWKKLTH